MHYRSLSALILASLSFGISTAFSQEVKLERVPPIGQGEAERVRANLATSKTGTKIAPVGQGQTPPEASIAIGQDQSQRLQLPSGQSLIPLEMADLYSVNRAFFRSFSAAGQVRVIGSNRQLPADSSEWEELIPPTDFGPRDFMDRDFPDRTLQYVMFVFTITTPGEVSPLGLMGEEFIDQASAQPPTAEELDELSESEKAALVPYDFASLVNGSAIVLISSGSVANANSMIDDDITTAYEFDADDPDAMLLLDLRASYRVNRVTLTMEAQPGLLQIYAFNVLPEQFHFDPDAPAVENGQSVVLDSGFFDRIFPIGAKEFEEPTELVEINFEDVDARFALIRWTPAKGSGLSAPLRIYELSFIGMIPDGTDSFRLVPGAEFAGLDPIVIPIPTPEPLPVEIPPPASMR